MSNLYFILTKKEITSLTKNRYLKFSYYGKVQNYFVYGRFGRHLDLIRSMVCLENNTSDESAYLKCLDSLKKRRYNNIILNTNFILTHNDLYKIK